MSNEFGDAALTAGSGAPEAYKQAGMAMVISGLTNIMVGLLWTCMGLSTCVSTYGICFFCPFMGIIPLAVGVYEILEGNKVREGIWSPNIRTTNLVGLVMGVLSMHMIGVACEGFVMMQLSDPKVKAFLDTPQ